MTTPPVQVERRVGQRFPYLLPLSLRQPATALEGIGFTQDLSSRGVFFFTDAPLAEGAEIEITLRMPSEITLGESMPVRCRGRILRVVRACGQERARFFARRKRKSELRCVSKATNIFLSPPSPPLSPGFDPSPPARRRTAAGSIVRPSGSRLDLLCTGPSAALHGRFPRC